MDTNVSQMNTNEHRLIRQNAKAMRCNSKLQLSGL